MRTWGRLAALVLLLLAGAAILLLVPLPTPEEIHLRVASAGAWAPVLFGVLYVVATLLLLPKNLLSAAAGLAFGLTLGVAVVWVAAILGASASFWLGRRLGRDGVSRLAGRHLVRLDDLVRRHGTLAVLIARLIPVVPFTAVNYGSGLTAVGFRAYLLATVVGIVPGTVAYVAVGAYGTEPGGWRFISAAGALLLLTVGGVVVARRRSRGPTGPAGGRPVAAEDA